MINSCVSMTSKKSPLKFSSFFGCMLYIRTFFFSILHQTLGVRIIYECVLYTSAYYIRVRVILETLRYPRSTLYIILLKYDDSLKVYQHGLKNCWILSPTLSASHRLLGEWPHSTISQNPPGMCSAHFQRRRHHTLPVNIKTKLHTAEGVDQLHRLKNTKFTEEVPD